MKTFRLVYLKIFDEDDGFKHTEIPLEDGLIINREDEENRWTIEALTSRSYLNYFKKLQKKDHIMIQVKITKETNDPATFLTKIIDMNEIGSEMNVLFMGTIIDQRTEKIEYILENLINQGFAGEELLRQFKLHFFN